MQDGTEPLPATTYSGAINQNPPTEANIAQAKKELVDSRTISKKGDPFLMLQIYDANAGMPRIRRQIS